MLDPPIRAVLFDCDGTLLDNISLHRKINHRLTLEFGFAGPIYYFSCHPTRALSKAGLSKKQILDFWQKFKEQELAEGVKVCPDTNELLMKLHARGVITAVVTNRHLSVGFFELLTAARLNLSYVDFFINYQHRIVDDLTVQRPMNCFLVRYGKPDKRFLGPIIDRLRPLPDFPGSVLVVGDSVKLDYTLAKRMNFQFIGVESGADTRENFLKVIDGKFIIKNVGELINMLS